MPSCSTTSSAASFVYLLFLLQVGMEALRCAEPLLGPSHRDDVIALSLYRRHNRCVDGNLQVIAYLLDSYQL